MAETDLQKATFAGGCFWCMEPPYKDIKGVKSVTVGYTGGQKANPTYEEVSSGLTGHAEAVGVDWESWWRNRTYHLMGNFATSNVSGDPLAIERLQRFTAEVMPLAKD